MISFLIGTIEDKQENSLLLDVGGVGFEMSISSNTFSALPMIGESVKVLTYMSVREDDISLYGFSSKEEKDLFVKLISVSGIGPKVAISILSGLTLNALSIAIANKDVKMLSKIKGLGAKTAERICVELKDKVSAFPLIDGNQADDYDESAVQMATDTLIALGISKSEAYMLARSNAGDNASAEEIIAKSLRGYRG